MATTVANLNGLFKEVYGDDYIDLVPESAKIVKKVPFVPADKEEGNQYHQPVILSYEHGVTYAAADAGAFTLNAAVAMNMKDAQIKGTQMLLRSALPYDVAAKASSKGKKSFAKATELIVENMLESITKRLELSALYGQSTTGIGNPTGSANVDATHTVITISLLTWSAGIWAGLENATIDVLDAGVVVNVNGAVTIDSIDLDARTITVSAAAADITLIDAVTFTTADAIVFRGGLAEMNGLDKIITNTGTLFNISAATYKLWKGNTYSSASAALTFGKVLIGLSAPVLRGLMEEATLYCNPKTFADLSDDLAALRMYDSSFSGNQLQMGTESIKYFTQAGVLEVVPHLFVKEGEAFIVPMKRVKRLGAQDVSFKTPGRGDEIFTQLQDSAGFELRVYSDQAVFVECPAKCLKITNIVNTV
jgi:hypothetical protein